MPSMTITTTTENATELAAAVGWKLGLNGNASAAQVKAYTIDFLKEVHRQHQDWLRELAKAPIVPIEPT
jgi:hypothetical protein